MVAIPHPFPLTYPSSPPTHRPGHHVPSGIKRTTYEGFQAVAMPDTWGAMKPMPGTSKTSAATLEKPADWNAGRGFLSRWHPSARSCWRGLKIRCPSLHMYASVTQWMKEMFLSDRLQGRYTSDLHGMISEIFRRNYFPASMGNRAIRMLECTTPQLCHSQRNRPGGESPPPKLHTT